MMRQGSHEANFHGSSLRRGRGTWHDGEWLGQEGYDGTRRTTYTWRRRCGVWRRTATAATTVVSWQPQSQQHQCSLSSSRISSSISLSGSSLSSISAVSAAASASAVVAGVAAASAPVARRSPLRGLWPGAVYLSRETSSPWWINGPTPHSRLEGLKLPSLIKSNQSRI